MLVKNVTRDVSLGSDIIIADTSATRRTGLLKHQTLEPGQGLLIVPCEGVHTIGMKFPIDVVFLNKKKKILKIRPDMGKWRMSLCLRAHSVLELPSGMVDKTGTRVGDELAWEKGK